MLCNHLPCFEMPVFRRFTTSSEISITPAGVGLSIDTERGSDECAAPILFAAQLFVTAILYCLQNGRGSKI